MRCVTPPCALVWFSATRGGGRRHCIHIIRELQAQVAKGAQVVQHQVYNGGFEPLTNVVSALVARQRNFCSQFHQCAVGQSQNIKPKRGVLAHQTQLIGIESAGYVQDSVWNGDPGNIVQARGIFDQWGLRLWQAKHSRCITHANATRFTCSQVFWVWASTASAKVHSIFFCGSRKISCRVTLSKVMTSLWAYISSNCWSIFPNSVACVI